MSAIRLLAAITSLGGVRQSDRSFAAEEVARMFGADVIIISGSAATVSHDWHGRWVQFDAACTVTVPTGLPKDFSCGWSQESAGQVTFVQGSGATLTSIGGLLKSSAQYAMGALVSTTRGAMRLSGNLVA